MCDFDISCHQSRANTTSNSANTPPAISSDYQCGSCVYISFQIYCTLSIFHLIHPFLLFLLCFRSSFGFLCCCFLSVNLVSPPLLLITTLFLLFSVSVVLLLFSLSSVPESPHPPFPLSSSLSLSAAFPLLVVSLLLSLLREPNNEVELRSWHEREDEKTLSYFHSDKL